MTKDLAGLAALAPEKLVVIDATRGWAILLVMLVHSKGLYPELPWPVARIAAFGWYGVQLFFVASAFTLLLSWHRHQAPLSFKLEICFIRRFFRIAPLYYLAAFAYLVHWAVIDTLRRFGGSVIDFKVTGVPAIAWFLPSFLLVVLVTFLIARGSYVIVERPFIVWSKRFRISGTAPLRVQG